MAGEHWYEPSIGHATELLRFIYENPAEAATRGQTAQQEIASEYSIEAVASMIEHRLQAISNRVPFRALQRQVRKGFNFELQRFSSLGAYLPEQQLKYAQLKE